MLLPPSANLPASREDEAPISLWPPVQTVDGTAHLNPSPWTSMESSVHPCLCSPHLHLQPPHPLQPQAWRPSAPPCPLCPFGRTPETAAEPSTFEQQLLGFHRRQDTLLASWSQPRSTLMAQQNQLPQQLTKQSRWLADGVEPSTKPLSTWWQDALPREPYSRSHTMSQLVERHRDHPGVLSCAWRSSYRS